MSKIIKILLITGGSLSIIGILFLVTNYTSPPIKRVAKQFTKTNFYFFDKARPVSGIGYYQVATDNSTLFIVTTIQNIHKEQNSMYMDMQITTDGIVKKSLLTDDNYFRLYLQKQSTYNLFPSSSQIHLQKIPSNKVLSTLNDYINTSVVAILPLKLPSTENAKIDKNKINKIFSAIKPYFECNQQLAQKLQQNTATSLQCTPYVSQINVYVQNL